VCSDGDREYVEFDVDIEKASAASPYIKRRLASLSHRRTFKFINVSPYQMQTFLKHLHTGIYDPADISRWHKDKFSVIHGQLDFYLFCVKLEYKLLIDQVRVGIQGAFDALSWSPLPDLHDTVKFSYGTQVEGYYLGAGHTGTLLVLLFDGTANYYPLISTDDPLRKSLLRYLVNLWRSYSTLFLEDRVDAYMTKRRPELWQDMKSYKEEFPADFYESHAPKYGRGGWDKISLAEIIDLLRSNLPNDLYSTS